MIQVIDKLFEQHNSKNVPHLMVRNQKQKQTKISIKFKMESS